MNKKEIMGNVVKGAVVFGAAVAASAIGKVLGNQAMKLGDSVKKYITEKTPKEKIESIFED